MSSDFEEDIFGLLNDNYGELSSIFAQYAKSGTAGSSSTSAMLTMQTTEFTTARNGGSNSGP